MNAAKRTLFLVGIIFVLVFPISAQAATTLTVTPLTWNVIGLDSNSPASGPKYFPVGVRVCSSVATTNVEVDFVWDSANANINLRTGSLSSITIASIAAGGCSDAYFEVEVNQVAGAYDTARRYLITATDASGTASSPTPRELFVEHLISQSRNGITDIKLDGVVIPAGGSMTLMVGNTYAIELDGGTATQGYNQFEAFINFPNTIFQVLSVSTTYSADNSPYVPNPNDKLYADACLWENDPNSPNYLSCVGGDYKVGGNNVVTTYNVKILSGGGTSQTLNSLLYDFSGSSFHYNSDYSTGAVVANIVDFTNVGISKNFSPSTTNVNGVSALTITLSNPNPGTISGFNFVDNLPSNMTVANPPAATTTSCGTPTFAPGAGATSISFSNGTIAANSSCIIKVNVTASATATYTNTTNDLFVGTLDTGKTATAQLIVNNAPAPPACTPGLQLAYWDFTASITPNFISSKVSSATASDAGGLTSTVPDTQNGQVGWSLTSINGGPYWPSTASPPLGYPLGGAAPYFQFLVDTTNFTGVQITFDVDVEGNWAAANNNHIYVWSNANGGAFYTTARLDITPVSKNTWYTNNTATASTTGTNTTAFRINEIGAKTTGTMPRVVLDNVSITGCGVPAQPTITKAFSPNPIAVNAISTLTFTITNENNVALTGAAFTDNLPTGLEVANPTGASNTCGATFAPNVGDTTLTVTGGTIPARVGTTNGSCTVTVSIKATTAGPHNNVSGYISTTQTGTNTGSTGSASASMTAVLPPVIAKQFAPTPILANGTSTLTFIITNPNQNDSLSGVAFSDTFPISPGNMVVANPTGASTSGCGSPTFAPVAGAGSVSFTGGTVTGGGSCTVTVNVTGPTVGTYNNTSGNVSATGTGNGNTASASLIVKPPTPAIAILKQVSTTATGPWTSFLAISAGANVYYMFTIENIGDVPLDPVSVSDPTLAGTSVDPATCSWTNPLPVASQTQDPTETCVKGSVTTASGSHPNTATSHGTYGIIHDSTPSTATYATTGLTLDKSVDVSSFPNEGYLLAYSYLVTNNGSASLAGPVTVADDKSTDETCLAVSTVGDLDNYLDPGESITCTATYEVTAGDVTTGSVTNIASASTALYGLIPAVTSNTDSVTVSYIPTLVFLADFRAYEEAGQVVVRWETAYERNTLGFNLLRLDPVTGEYREINSGLLPGMLTPHRSGIYTFIDRGALSGNTYTYKLIEVELNGRQLSYGPFTVRVGNTTGESSGLTASSSYGRIEKGKSALYEARIEARKALLHTSETRTVQAVRGTRLKITVTDPGIYYVDAADISSMMGIPLGEVTYMIRNGRLSLSNQGKQVAYLPAKNNAGLYFYGTRINSVYTKDNVYWIDDAIGNLMRVIQGTGPSPVSEAESFTDTVHFEEDLDPWEIFFNDPNADYWFWDQIFSSDYYSDPPKDFTFQVRGLSDTQTTATLQVHLFGGSDAGIANDHHVIIGLNGQQIAEDWWSGLTGHTVTVTAPVISGQNILTVEGMNQPGFASFVLINSFDVTYERYYTADGNGLFFKGDGNQTVTVGGFTSPDIMVFDITNPFRPMLNSAITIDGVSGSISLIPAAPTTPYLAVSGGGVTRASSKAITASTLSSKENAADYVIVVPDSLFITAAQSLASYRAGQGLKTLVVKLEDIVNEFNYGISSPEAIKKFLSIAHSRWRKSPRYVVLAGDGSMDYKDNLGFGGNLIPSKMVSTAFGLSISDNYLADVNGDHLPEIAIGRLPVISSDELLTIINKIKTYEGTGGKEVILLADTPDEGGDFIADSQEIAALFSSRYNIDTIYLYDPAMIDSVRAALFTAINNGAVFFNYVGHAAPTFLSYSWLLSVDDLPYSLLNAYRLPIMTAMTCIMGNFSDPYEAVLSEALLLYNNGGVAATWSPTGLSGDTLAKILNQEFYKAIISGGNKVLGEAVLQALSVYKKQGAMPFMMDIYGILGDPALRIR